MKKLFWYIVPNISGKVLAYVLIPLYTSYLTIEEFGLLELLLVTLSLLPFLFSFGWTSSFVRFFNDEKFEKSLVLNTTLIVRVAIHVLILVIYFSSKNKLINYFFLNYDNGTFFLDLIIYIYILQDYINLSKEYFRSTGKYIHYGLTNFVHDFFRAGFTILFLVFYNLSILSVLYGLLISNVIIAIYSVIYLAFKEELILKSFDSNFLRESFIFGTPLIIASIAFYIMNFSDRYMLKILLPNHVALKEIGLLSFYAKITSLSFVVTMLFQTLWAPFVIKIFRKKISKVLFENILEIYLIILFVFFTLNSVFSYQIANLFTLNSMFLEKYYLIPILYLPVLFISFGDFAPIGIDIKKQTKIRAYASFCFCSLNIAFNYLLIPNYLIEGAIFASTISFSGYLIVLNFYSFKLFAMKLNYWLILLIVVEQISFFLVQKLNESLLSSTIIAITSSLPVLILFLRKRKTFTRVLSYSSNFI